MIGSARRTAQSARRQLALQRGRGHVGVEIHDDVNLISVQVDVARQRAFLRGAEEAVHIVPADAQHPSAKEGPLDVLGLADREEPAVVDEPDPVAAFRFLHVVRRHEERHPFFLERVDLRPDLPSGHRVHAGGGFVEEQDARIVDGRRREGEALLPAAGERACQLVTARREAHRLHDRLDLRAHCAPAAVDAVEERQVLLDGEVVVETESL